MSVNYDLSPFDCMIKLSFILYYFMIGAGLRFTMEIRFLDEVLQPSLNFYFLTIKMHIPLLFVRNEIFLQFVVWSVQ